MADPAAEQSPDPDPAFDRAIDDPRGSGAVAAPLIEPDQGWIEDDEATVVATEAAGEVESLSAEEAAVHIVDEDHAPGVTWDESPGYVDEDPTEQPYGFDADPSTAGGS